MSSALRTLTWDQLEQMLTNSGKFARDTIGVTQDVEDDIMMHEVADAVAEILMRHIQSDIYGAYTPKVIQWGKSNVPTGWRRLNDHEIQYARRGSLTYGALGMYREIQNGTLFVTSDAEVNQPVIGSWNSSDHGAFLGLLEDGPSRVFSGVGPRPVINNAQAEIDNSPEIEEAYERGLKRHGII